MAIFMKFGAVEGPVTTKGYEKWTELTSFQFGVGRGIGSAMAGGSGRESSAPSIREIVVNKIMDVSSPGLWKDATAGEVNTTVSIFFTRTSAGETIDFLSYELIDCGLSGYSVSSGGDMPTESLSMNFAKINWTLKYPASDGTTTPSTQGYDLTTQTST